MSAGPARAWVDLGFDRALVADAGRGLCLVAIGAARAEGVLEAWCARHLAGAEARPTGPVSGPPGPQERLERASAQLTEYAAGTRTRFELELDLRGTPFELEVWRALLEIGFGATRTYGELAAGLGRPGGARAVGGAAGRNPVPVVVPCHRLLAAGGLGGFTGGLDTKRALLALEGHPSEKQLEFP